MIKSKTIFLFCFVINCLITNISYSQTFDSIIKTYLEKKEEKKEYQSSVNYAIYKGITGNQKMETYSGIQAYYNKTVYLLLQKTEFIVNEEFIIKLNSDEKAINVSRNLDYAAGSTMELNLKKIAPYLINKTIKSDADNWILSFEVNRTDLLKVSKVELIIDKKSFFLKKQSAILPYTIDFRMYKAFKENEAIDNLRMEIIYSNYINKVKVSKDKFKLGNYVQQAINTYIPSDKYKDFEVISNN